MTYHMCEIEWDYNNEVRENELQRTLGTATGTN